MQSAFDINGQLQCMAAYDCCKCESIECGTQSNIKCESVRIGNYGALAVKDIRINGNDMNGAVIECNGIDSCRETVIESFAMESIDCEGVRACKDAQIRVIEPKEGFVLDCSGIDSCANMKITIDFMGSACTPLSNVPIVSFSKVSCGEQACNGLEIIINNVGCNEIVIDSIDCLQPNSCNNAHFVFVGKIDIMQCQCGPSCALAMGLNEVCSINIDNVRCQNQFECYLQNKVINNALNGFFIECSNDGSCQESNFQITLPQKHRAAVTHFGSFIFGGFMAAKDAIFYIDNQQNVILKIDKLECSGTSSCVGTTFIVSDFVWIENIICAQDACLGCLIKQNMNDPGIPCDATQGSMPIITFI